MDDLHARLIDSHEAVDHVLQVTAEEVGRYGFQELRIELEGGAGQFRQLKDLRQQIDKAAVLPIAERGHDLSQRWFAASTALILQTQDLARAIRETLESPVQGENDVPARAAL